MLAHFSHHLLTALPTPLLPFIRDEFALDYTQAGLIVSAFSLSYGLSQLPAGWISDRIGPRKVITVGIAGAAVFGLLMGVAYTYTLVIALVILIGIAAGGYHPTVPPLLSASVETGKLGRALGLHAIGGSASYFAVPLIAAVMAAVWGWRSPFIGLAIPTLLVGVAFYILLGKVPAVKKIELERTSKKGGEPLPPPAPGYLRRLVPFMVLSSFANATTSAVASFVPLIMVDNFGITRGAAASFLALLYAAGFWAGPLGGYLSDRLSRTRMMIAIGFVSAPIIYLLNLASSAWAIGAVLVAMGTVNYIRMPVSESYVVSQAPQRYRSTILGIYYFAGMEGIGLIMPIVGNMIDNLGSYLAFTITGAIMVFVAAVCSLFLRGSPGTPQPVS